MTPITTALLRAALPNARAADIARFADPLARACAARSITTPPRVAHFLAQIGHESGSLRYVRELADGTAYEGRADLGNTRPGDGPRFRGRGLIQITGRANYAALGKVMGAPLLEHPELLEEPAAAAFSAAWFWDCRGLNTLADADDIRGITRRINGGLNGLADRQRLLDLAKRVLAPPPLPSERAPSFPPAND